MQAWLLEWYNIDYSPLSMAEMTDDEMSDMDHGGMNMSGMPATNPDDDGDVRRVQPSGRGRVRGRMV